MSITFTNFRYPIILCDEEVESIELDEDLRIDELCPNKAEQIKEDIYPYLICFRILSVAQLTDRLPCLDTDEPFKVQLRNMFPEVKRTTLNYLRSYIAKRTITTMFFQNIWFDREIEEILGLPSSFDFALDSDIFRIWKNFCHTPLSCRQPLIDTLRMCDNDHLSHYRDDLVRSSSATRLKEIHDEVTKEYNLIQELINAEKLAKPFPAPELKSEPPEGITFIENGKRLLEEGRKMHHCVASYVDICLAGNSFVFHVSAEGSEATLELGKKGEVKQFKSFHNSEPAPALHSLVSSWVR